MIDRLTEILALEEKASPSPWQADTTIPDDCVIEGMDGCFLANIGNDKRPNAIAFDLYFEPNAKVIAISRNLLRPLIEVVQAADVILGPNWDTKDWDRLAAARAALKSQLEKSYRG